MGEAPRHHAGLAVLSLGALGIVFGDIGTSPLYALQTVFAADEHAVRPTESGVYGVISLVFWAITLIVSIKYVALIMRADNEGEGGIMALIALIREKGLQRRFAQVTLVALGIFGASLFYGDGMITPAISVLSAVEGIEVVEPSLHELVVPITLVILAVLFTIQRFGTGAVGRLFGPIMALWFTLLAIAGLHEVVKEPGILRAISPTYAVSFMFEHGHVAFIALGSVVLTVTGAEALYADMGHFGRHPIRLSWFSAVFPALILNYMGQGALILRNPEAIENPFYLLIPHWGRIPMIGLATIATVIASQAVISGAFSVTRQAVQLGFLPRLTIRHTSREAGQVYVPAVNWGIFVAVVALVVGFGSSQHLAAAYGIAVTGTLAIDTRAVLRRRPHRVGQAEAAGGHRRDRVPDRRPHVLHRQPAEDRPRRLVPARDRRRRVRRAHHLAARARDRHQEADRARGPAARLRRGDPRPRPADLRASPRTGIFLDANPETTPLALRANVEHNCVLHDSVVIVTVVTLNVPHVDEDERVTVDDLGYRDDGITHLTARFGFQDDLDVPRTLRRAAKRLERDADFEHVSYFLSRITIIPGKTPGMALWRKKLFITIARNAASPVPYFHLPDDRTIVMSSHIEL